MPAELQKDPRDVAAARKHYKLPTSLVPLPASGSGSGSSSGSEAVGAGIVRVFEVTDHMPNPVWTSNVVSTEEFVDTAQGMWVRIRSPMGVVMETFWIIREFFFWPCSKKIPT